MKIGLCQFDLAWHDCKKNIQKIGDYIEQAEQQNADLIVFPEMALSGFSMEPRSAAVKAHGEEMRDLLALTRGKRVMAVVGTAIKDGYDFYNSSLVIRNGEILTSYSKINLFAPSGEDEVYRSGETLVLVDTEEFSFVPLVCFDLRFSKVFTRAAAALDPDAYIVIASWPAAQAEQWRTLLAARAIDTQSYVIGVNRVGSGDGIAYHGNSNIIAPSGKALLNYSHEEGLVFAEIDSGYCRKLKQKYKVLSDQHHKHFHVDTKKIKIGSIPARCQKNGARELPY